MEAYAAKIREDEEDMDASRRTSATPPPAEASSRRPAPAYHPTMAYIPHDVTYSAVGRMLDVHGDMDLPPPQPRAQARRLTVQGEYEHYLNLYIGERPDEVNLPRFWSVRASFFKMRY